MVVTECAVLLIHIPEFQHRLEGWLRCSECPQANEGIVSNKKPRSKHVGLIILHAKFIILYSYYHRNMSWRPTDVFPAKYDHLHIKNRANPVAGRGSLQGSEMLWIQHCLDKRPTDGVVMRLSAASTGHTLHPRNIFLFLSMVFIFVRG
jgi:hypothetical protein